MITKANEEIRILVYSNVYL